MAQPDEQKESVAPNQSARSSILICVLLFAVTLGIYWQLRTHTFINYDDPYYVTGNAEVQKGFTKEGVVWAFTRLTGHGTYWHPVTWLSHMMDCQLFGPKNAGAHHLMNAAIHALNAVLLFLLLNKLTAQSAADILSAGGRGKPADRMSAARWRSAIIAALFAWHPIQVESVAWAAERKNVLSTLFFLLMILAYSRYAQFKVQGSRFKVGWYSLTLVLFGIGLMCKPMLVTVPCVLLLLDVWPLRRVFSNQFSVSSSDSALSENWKLNTEHLLRLLYEKLPFFALSAISAYITIAAHKKLDLVVSTQEFSWSGRLINSVVAYGLYIWKLVWPTRLAIYYPLPDKWPAGGIAFAAVVLISISVLGLRYFKQRPWLLFGWLWFLGTMVPVIGLVQVNDQAMADRFAYVPSIGIFVIAVWGVAELLSRFHLPRIADVLLASSVLLAFAVTTWRQEQHWKNTETVFTHAAAVTKGNYVAHNNLGRELVEQGRTEEALAHFQEVIKVRYFTPLAHNNIGIWKATHNDLDGAMQSFQEAIRSDPKEADAYANMGLALIYKNQPSEALRFLSEAVRLNPNSVEARANLGTVYERLGQLADAQREYREVLRLKPDHAKANEQLQRLSASNSTR